MQESKPILLVEDDSVDVMTVKRGFKELAIPYSLVHLPNGEEALKYLKDKSNEEPTLILLDLNMPRMSGIEFIRAVKADPALKHIPIVVLTTSKNERDVTMSFELGVAGYLVKPADYEQFREAMGVVSAYWSLSELPDGK